MTPRPKHPMPSEAELRILKVLWERQPLTAKSIYEQLNAKSKTPRVITTTMKLLEIMRGKNLVQRDESTWPHLYRAKVPRNTVLRRVVAETLDSVFDKSASQFMLAALESGSVSATDIDRIKSMLEAYEEKRDDE
ncbi:MAG: BlaI/MecI/CopY family transcriptional regulator [Candidatus Hydrogenedentales bacterium]